MDKATGRCAVGDFVTLVFAPETLLQGLPEADQDAIKAVVGKPVRVGGYDDYGHVELEFKDKNGIIHFIWVEPSAVRRADV